MSYIPDDYVERTYAGWLGKLIGVRYGAPTEGASFEFLREYYGELDGYLVDFKDFAADDDTNGPMFFLRALEDSGKGADITAQDMSKAWLNYPPYERGFYWWGGYGNSTEHTAYLNLQNGIEAPRSGSVEQNGAVIAEQIGGQIFIDTWGLVAPNNPTLAADLAGKMASVSHGGDGKYGGIFVAAAISIAYSERDIVQVLKKALETIPADSGYALMVKDIMRYYYETPEDWEKCFWYIRENYWQDKYGGACHIIPNSAIMVMSMMYGQGDFDKTLNICHMGGWDTDCTLGNVGAITGTLVGLENINYEKWRMQINDFFVASSTIGNLNIMTAPACVAYIAKQAYKLANEPIPSKWKEFVECDYELYNFELPGSTHGMRARVETQKGDTYYFPDHKEKDQRLERTILKNSTEQAYSGNASLKVSLSGRESSGNTLRVYTKTYYHPEDLHNDRYAPCFSPTVYPGMTVETQVMLPKNDKEIKATMYAIDGITGNEIRGEFVSLSDGSWENLKLVIPSSDARIEEVGVVFFSRGITPLIGFIDDFKIYGKPNYRIDFAKEQMERFTLMHKEVGQFSIWKGMWDLEDDVLVGVCYDRGEIYTGKYYMYDYTLTATLRPKTGNAHRLLTRVKGATSSYSIGLSEDNKLTIEKNDNGFTELASISYDWDVDKSYTFSIECKGNSIKVYNEEGKLLLQAEDSENPYLYGCIGAGVRDGSRCEYANFIIEPSRV